MDRPIEEYDDDDDDSDGEGVGAQAPPLTEHIANILKEYPSGGQILKELIQNADDAGAREVKFLVDSRDHDPIDTLFSPRFGQFQGPALYAWNSARFKKHDWQSLAKINKSSKEKDVLKIGKFGLGFMSVFHLTDLPLVLSGRFVAFIDPHRSTVQSPETSPAGVRKHLSEVLKHAGHASTFHRIFGVNKDESKYEGTLFRFPLRKPGNKSKISQKCVSVADIKRLHFESFKVEAPFILLFLRNIVKISIYEFNQQEKTSPLFSVQVQDNCLSSDLKQRKLLYKEQISLKSIHLYGLTIQITPHSENGGGQTKLYHWLVLNVMGTTVPQILKLGQELSSFPCIGLACQVPVYIEHSVSVSSSSETLIDIVDSLLESSSSLGQLCLPSKINSPLTSGRAICYLPLPTRTYLPIHVNGSFAVASNRRSIAWPDHDVRNDETDWNEMIVEKMIAPAYSLLLLINSKLFRFKKPLDSTVADDYRNAYSLWPVYNEIKNEQIWSKLLEPVLSTLKYSKILWSDVAGGKWVSLNEAFLATKDCPRIVIKALLSAGLPVVLLPPKIYDTLESANLEKDLKEREITPCVLRNNYPQNFQCSRKETLLLLNFVLSDINSSNVTEIHNLPLLPVFDGSFCIFEREKSNNTKYLLPSSLVELYKTGAPGTESMVVSTAISETTYHLLEKTCQHTQIKMADCRDFFQDIVRHSIDTWANPGDSILWEPRKNVKFSTMWLTDIWKFICKKNCYQDIVGLPIVPMKVSSNTYRLVRYIPSLCFCYIPHSHSHELPSALNKLQFIVVDEFLTSHCSLFSKITVQKLLDTLPTNCNQLVYQMTDGERDALLLFIAQQSGKLNSKYIPKVRMLPIFKVVGRESEFVYTSLNGPVTPFLCPSEDEIFKPFPPGMLLVHENLIIKFLRKIDDLNLNLTFTEFCVKHWIPFAIELLQSSRFDDGETIIFKVFKYLQGELRRQRIKANSSILNCLKCEKIVSNRDGHYYKVCDMYDSCMEFKILIDDLNRLTPDEKYLHYKSVLQYLGLKTWNQIRKNRMEFFNLLKCSASNANRVNPTDLFKRSKFLLQQVQDSTSPLYDEDKLTLATVQFLLAAPPPASYPKSLKWFASANRQNCDLQLYSIQELLPYASELRNRVGSVMPIASKEYSITSRKYFRKLKENDVLQQLQYIESADIQSYDYYAINIMVMSIYQYLESQKLQIDKIWIFSGSPPRFVDSKQFVKVLPFNMQPFFYCFPSEYNKLATLWNIKSSIDEPNCLIALKQLQKSSRMDAAQEKMIFDITNWLFDRKYGSNNENMLLLSSDKKLEPASSMVYDDREWNSESANVLETFMQSKSVKFVHPKVPSAVAQHFGVIPFSRIVAPSANLKIQYIKAGQHESITNRISKIVQDYDSDIDIFKELIQNADDAGATEVKFLIDWRRHSHSRLLAKGMDAWQGPALLAYNNEVFKDEDLSNICKVAGESKKSDPSKIGRFGVGFCATYHLTDVPSFVTGRNLVIFDPHTSYLGDRVSRSEPGMRIDLVQTQSDLLFYKDQFEPYDKVFDCDIFELKDDGYSGTLFRFPFRDANTSKKSEICPKVYNDMEISHLISALKTCGEELVLFLKHVNKISFFELKEGSVVADMKELFSISRCLQNTVRLDVLEKHPEARNSHSECSIEMKDSTTISESKWLICSYRGTYISDDQSLQGLLQFGEIAIKLKRDNCYRCYDKVKGKIFCFLPLPISSGLNFHMNGYFVVSKDRRNIPIANKTAPYSKWNVSLCSKVLSYAFLEVLKYFADVAHMKTYLPNIKEKFLESYYQLLDFKMLLIEGVATIVKNSIEDLLSSTDVPILWSEVNSGTWFAPKDVVLYEGEPKNLLPDINRVLLMCEFHLVVIPKHVRLLIKEKVGKVLNYQEFILDILFPHINEEQFKKSWELHLLNILDTFTFEYVGHIQKWPLKKLQSEPCIPCQATTVLKRISEVVDCSEPIITKLFEKSEGRFPIENLLKYKKAKNNLIYLGMSSSLLSVDLLINRAASVQHMESVKDAMKRSHVIIEYIKNLTYDYFSTTPLKEKLSQIPFIPFCMQPDGFQLPWLNNQAKLPFCTPAELYDYSQRYLVFTVAKVASAEVGAASYCLLTKKTPDPMEVVQHLKLLIKASEKLQQKKEMKEKTIEFLDKVVYEIYKYFEKQLDKLETVENEQFVKELQSIKCPLWHDEVFKSPESVVYKCSFACPPYLSQLSEKYLKFKILLTQVFNVQEKLSLESMISLLINVHRAYPPPTRLSDQILQFVIQLSLHIAKLIGDDIVIDRSTLVLPDSDGILRNVSSLACDDHKSDFIKKSQVYRRHFEKGSGFFVHRDIPRHKAIKLGVYPILDAVMKGFEDEDFLSGEEYGQQENLCVRLNSILSKYPVDVSILQEFVQNADDAQASEVIFVLDHRINHPDRTLFCDNEKWKELQHTPALCIINNRKFSEADIVGISKLGEGNKQESVKSIGKFGIGFNVAYHITDCPSFLSYGENNIPENLCAFDPTHSYVGNRKPGRRWKLQYKGVEELKDQFSPFLFQDICEGRIKLSYKQSGYVVFRLPLTKTDTAKKYWHLNEHKFSMIQLKNLLAKYGELSKELLLFLSNVKELSCIEIEMDGNCAQLFRVHSSIPQKFEQSCGEFVSHCDSYKDTVLGECKVQKVSVFHRLDVDFYSKLNGDLIEKNSWLIQKILFGQYEKSTLKEALGHNLRAIGAVAAPLDAVSKDVLQKVVEQRGYTGSIGKLFCYLPLPISTSLPVHIHGHFITDDSRKHLENVKIAEKNWNLQVIQDIVVPAYLELMINTKAYILSDLSDLNLVEISVYLYNLFPPYQNNHSLLRKQETEDVCSHLNRCFYTKFSNCQAPLFLVANKSQKWFPLHKIYFCVSSCVFEKGSEMMNENLGKALQELGMNIVCSASHISLNLHNFELTDRFLYQYEVIDYLSTVKTEDPGVTAIIKANLSNFLRYCLDGNKPKKVPSILSRIPLILTADGCLQRCWEVYSQKYSKLLLNSLKSILDESHYGSVRHKLGHIIKTPSLDFIDKEIPLPKTKLPTSLNDEQIKIVCLLWQCLSEDRQYQYQSAVFIEKGKTSLHKYFLEKPVLPASGDVFYPMCVSKTLVEISDKRVSHVLQKLKYNKLNMSLLGIVNDEQLLLNIKECVFSRHEDIIACFQQQRPALVDLSMEETQTVLQLLQSCSTQQLESVSEIVRSLKIFSHATGNYYVALEDVRALVFPEKVPIAGIEVIEQTDNVVFLKVPEKLWMPVYTSVIPKFNSLIIDQSELYCHHILPNIEKMKEEDRIYHVDFVFKELKKDAINLLKDIPFLQNGDIVVCAQDLYDPEVEFFAAFRGADLPSKPWHDQYRLNYLRALGLQNHVSHDEWLNQARLFSHSSTSHEFVKKSKLLFDELLKMILNASDGDISLKEFLHEVSEIRFMFSSEEVIDKLKLFQKMKFNFKTQKDRVVCFKESVLFENALLAFHKHSSLPEECSILKNKTIIIKYLGIVHPLTSEVVVKNLILVCECINKHTWTNEGYNKVLCNQMYELILGHYKFLEKIAEYKVFDQLKDKNCIVVKSGQLLKAIKPCHTVQHNSQFDMEPFCYILPREIAYYQKFVEHLGIEERLAASSYALILQNISEATSRDLNKSTQETKQIAIQVFNSLIRDLREQGHVLCDDFDGPLISDNFKFLPVRELVYNDARWYSSRISSSFCFVLTPEPDQTGNRMPPASLKVPLLSNLVKEVLRADCKLGNARCKLDELYYEKKRESRCVFSQSIIETFTSAKFLEGMCRIYYADHQLNPTETFKESVLQFQKYEVVCLAIPIVTVLLEKGVLNPNSEDNSKLCFLSLNDGIMYIYPHFHSFEVRDLMKEIASEINNALGCPLKSEQHIASMFMYAPKEIESVLTHSRVPEYSVNAVRSISLNKVGSEAKFSETILKEALIFVNYDTGEIVKYYTPDGKLIYAKVLKGFDYIQRSSITKQCIEIIAEREEGNDDESHSFFVSPLEIFKILTLPQINNLEEEGRVPFSKPVVLAAIPKSLDKVRKWVSILYNSEDILMYSGFTVCMINYRIYAHFHYHFQSGNITKDILTAATFKVLDCISDNELPYTDMKKQPKLCEQLDNLSMLLASMEIDDYDTSSSSYYSLDGSRTPVSSQENSPEPEDIFEQSADGLSQGSAGDVPSTIPPYINAPPASTSQLVSGSTISQTQHSWVISTAATGTSQTTHSQITSISPSQSSSTTHSQITSSRPAMRSFPVSSRFVIPPQSVAQRPVLTRNRFRISSKVKECRIPPFCEVKAKAWLEQALEDYVAAQDLCDDSGNETCKHPALVCFLCHDVVLKCLMGLYFTYLDEGHFFSNSGFNLVQLINIIKANPGKVEEDNWKAVTETCEEVVMTVSGYDTMCRFPSAHVPSCAPVAAYTRSDARESLAVAAKLIKKLKSIQVLNDMINIPDPKFRSSLKSSVCNDPFPDNWDDMEEKDEVKEYLVNPETEYEEYSRIFEQFQLTLPNSAVFKIYRIQNKDLWRKYRTCSEEMDKNNEGILNEKLLFHGSRSTSPKSIYMSATGFDERFSRDGMWGRGNYFAQNANYSDSYAHREGAFKEMFAAYVLTGISFPSMPNATLRMPPELTDRADGGEGAKVKRRYDSVTGTLSGTRVYITYDNIHAYPAYLIVYQ